MTRPISAPSSSGASQEQAIEADEDYWEATPTGLRSFPLSISRFGDKQLPVPLSGVENEKGKDCRTEEEIETSAA